MIEYFRREIDYAVPDSLIRTLLSEYEQRRTVAQQQAQDRKTALYRRIPRLQAIEEELEAIGLRAVRRYLQSSSMSKEQIMTSLKQDNERLLAEKRRLLSEAGVSEEDLAVHYQCPICQDTGYVGGQNAAVYSSALSITLTINLTSKKLYVPKIFQRLICSAFLPPFPMVNRILLGTMRRRCGN